MISHDFARISFLVVRVNVNLTEHGGSENRRINDDRGGRTLAGIAPATFPPALIDLPKGQGHGKNRELRERVNGNDAPLRCI
jgi:hypothetical protein